MYGGPGDDVMLGDAGNDEVWGGEGDDIIRLGGTARRIEDDVFFDIGRGGPGNDLIYGGFNQSFQGGSVGITDDQKFLYGDEGDDKIWGSSDITDQVIWGGKGDDFVQSA